MLESEVGLVLGTITAKAYVMPGLNHNDVKFLDDKLKELLTS